MRTKFWAMVAAFCSSATVSLAASSDRPASVAELSHGYLRQWSFQGRDALQTVNQPMRPASYFTAAFSPESSSTERSCVLFGDGR